MEADNRVRHRGDSAQAIGFSRW